MVDVRNEVWLPNHERRADVHMVFADGHKVAIEIQGYPLSDAEWVNRHRDYQHNGVVDVWLWRPDIRPHRIVLSDGDPRQQLWTFDPDQQSVTLFVGAPHRTLWPDPATQDDIFHRVRHLPPCMHDELIPLRCSLDELTLTSQGIPIPTALKEELAVEFVHENNRVLRSSEQDHDPDKRTHWTESVSSFGEKVVSPAKPRPSIDMAAITQLHWIELQNRFMNVGHVIAYEDAPQLRRPNAKQQLVQCIHCGQQLSSRTVADDIPTCASQSTAIPNSDQSRRAHTQPFSVQPRPTAKTSRRTTPSAPTQAQSTSRRQVPDQEQLSLFSL